jgi:hypothetical protein
MTYALFHYVVAIGYDDETVVIANPLKGRQVMGKDAFLRSWQGVSDMEGKRIGWDAVAFVSRILGLRSQLMIVTGAV